LPKLNPLSRMKKIIPYIPIIGLIVSFVYEKDFYLNIIAHSLIAFYAFLLIQILSLQALIYIIFIA
jgi:hypothetical protein